MEHGDGSWETEGNLFPSSLLGHRQSSVDLMPFMCLKRWHIALKNILTSLSF